MDDQQIFDLFKSVDYQIHRAKEDAMALSRMTFWLTLILHGAQAGFIYWLLS